MAPKALKADSFLRHACVRRSREERSWKGVETYKATDFRGSLKRNFSQEIFRERYMQAGSALATYSDFAEWQLQWAPEQIEREEKV